MGKLYERINWENSPSTKTPINAVNLNKMDEGIGKVADETEKLKTLYESAGEVLWSDAYLMTKSHTVALSKAISELPNGIVLVFSRYENDAVGDYGWNEFFVHKDTVGKHAGLGHSFFLTDALACIGTKYLYIYNDKITGYDGNAQSGTENGITYKNYGFVLRYVIGV